MLEVDLNKWNRKAQFEFYSQFEDPIFSITSNVDVTELIAYCKSKNIRVYPAYLYASQLVVNSIFEFRLRYVDGTLCEFDKLHAAPTIAAPDNTFRFSVFRMKSTFSEFVKEMDFRTENALESKELDLSYAQKDTVYYTVIPWISFTGFKNPNIIKGEDTPRIAFGKIFEQGDRLNMPVCVEVNHGLMDGYHVSLYLESFQNYLSNPKEYLNA